MYSLNEYRGLDIVLSLISGEILFALYPFCKFLKTREKEIPDLEFDKDVIPCPRCGAEINAKCKFCTQCGFQIIRDFHFPPEDIPMNNQSVVQADPVDRETEQKQEQDIMPNTEEKATDDNKIIICPVCGTKNLKTYSFCIECGICLNNPENFRKYISHPVCTQNQEKSESQPKETMDNQIQNIVIENGDVYLADAALMAADKDKIGIGKIQRVYKIGFNRAARIMNQLHEIGIVGEENGTSPRKVLVDKEKCKEILKNATISECPAPSYKPKLTDVYAEFCTASCEFDPSQNFQLAEIIEEPVQDIIKDEEVKSTSLSKEERDALIQFYKEQYKQKKISEQKARMDESDRLRKIKSQNYKLKKEDDKENRDQYDELTK